MYKYPEKPVKGKFIRRYKRFLTDVELDDGQIVTAHCTNTGSLASCLIPGAEVLLTPSNNPHRKTRFTWESIRIGDIWVGVNTSVPNKLIYNALKENLIPELTGFHTVKPEVKFQQSRFDLYLENEREKMFAEIKNVTYREGDFALFPDAPTQRGLKHLKELVSAVEQGYRAAIIFAIARPDARIFAPAAHVHPDYALMLKQAVDTGVEIYPLIIHYSEEGARVAGMMQYEL